MSAALVEAVVPSVGGIDDELCHSWCCDPLLALCGADLTDANDVDADTSCVVCADLEESDIPCAAADCAYRVTS